VMGGVDEEGVTWKSAFMCSCMIGTGRCVEVGLCVVRTQSQLLPPPRTVLRTLVHFKKQHVRPSDVRVSKPVEGRRRNSYGFPYEQLRDQMK
jgi:hypothetical protein